MIISSLCEYYAIMAKNGKVNKPGYIQVPINCIIFLDEDGTINSILPLDEKEGRKFCFPGYGGRETKIEAKALEYRSRYIFGLNYDNGTFTTEDPTDNAKKSHKAFVESHLKFTEGMWSPLIQAFRKFMQNWNPEEETENKCLLALGKRFNGNFAFCLNGKINDYLQDEKEIKEKWEKTLALSAEAEETPLAVCPVYGELLPVAEKHYPISANGILNGRTVICYNNQAEESYGKEKSYNSGISIRAMKEYTETLDYLLEAPDHHTPFGDIIVGYFALTDKKEEDYMNAINISFVLNFPSATTEQTEEEEIKEADAENVEENLNTVVEKVAAGKGINFSYFDKLDESVKYCIFGYSPIGKGRVALRFFYTNSFGNLRKNVEKWHNDFVIGENSCAPSFYRICTQLIERVEDKDDEQKDTKKNNPSKKKDKSKQKFYSELTERLLNSAVNGAPLPEKILEAVIRRIKTDLIMNSTRMGILKTCLNRKNKDGKEEITVSLNLENKNSAYLCGRLFAVLEKAQKESLKTEQDYATVTADEGPQKTIKDTYFSSAAATPATVFPVLIKRSNYHIAKLKEGPQIYYNRLISSIVDNLEEEFPKTLSLEQQGNFIIGYYQQNKDFYTAKNDKEEL